MKKKTKIVCTIGPASESEEMLEKLMLAGMNVCRLNFSHGSHDEHQQRIDRIKAVREKLGIPVALMLDTKGPEIRLGDFKDGIINLSTGDKFTLTTREILGDQSIISITYKGLPHDVKAGDRILIDDGLVELRVLEIIDNTDILCEVLNNGELKNHKGVNVPNIKTSLPAITTKDKDDILFGIRNDIDYIAASFIRKADDVNEIRKILEENDGEFIDIISKIENQEGIDNMDEIIKVSDGIMVARGDMGVEVPTEEMPIIQKNLIEKCYLAGKPVITATQMLDSMIRNPRPTRAEVTDVANSIIDGTSAIMLSGETAAGKYPLEAVQTMNKIAIRIEQSLDYKKIFREKLAIQEQTTTDAVTKSAVVVAQDLEAKAIVAATTGGYTARAVSKFRPETMIVAVTPNERVRRKLALSWGVETASANYFDTTDELIDGSLNAAVDAALLKEGDLAVVIAGIPVGFSGATNLIKVQTIATILLQGIGVGKKSGVGRVVVGNTEDELLPKFEHGDILVCSATDKDMVSFMENASAVIVEEGGFTSHAAIVGLHLDVPTIIGVKNATSILKDGDIITVDSESGNIYKGKATIR